MKQKNFMKMMAVMLTMSMLGTTPVMAGEGEEKVTLTIEMSQDMKAQNNEAVNEEIYAAFEEKYPNIEVEEILVPDAQYKNVVSTKISAGEPSDIIICNRLNGQTDYNAKENMLDLSDMEFVSRMKDPSIVTDEDGVIRCYQPKYSNEGSCIVYNKTLFDQFGLEIPQTWDAFLDVCQKLQDNGIQPLYSPYKEVWTFQIITSGTFGQLEAYKIPGTAEAINSGEKKWSEVPEFQEILERAMVLVEKGYFGDSYLSDDWVSAPSKMTSGAYGMMVAFNTTLPDLEGTEYEFGFFPMPFVDDIELSMAQPQASGCMFIPKDAAHIDAAKKYIDFVSTPEAGAISEKVSPYIPTVEGVEPEAVSGQQEVFNTEYLDKGKVVREFNSYVGVDMSQLWALYQEMLAELITPEEVMTQWDDIFADLMKQAGYEGF
ncbi:ABC transporter substrate-binding protein [Blautia sp. HCP3S3_G3]|uniref:ABC transporter substrate-binding protein n=1 Tax=Blautia sp. HCP3S3_G3 TaxID=3438913 RepID=UPI003F8A405A